MTSTPPVRWLAYGGRMIGLEAEGQIITGPYSLGHVTEGTCEPAAGWPLFLRFRPSLRLDWLEEWPVAQGAARLWTALILVEMPNPSLLHWK
ncbi:hypothetical protein VTI28DRAFT_2819 [Corynascus sepedonium]